MSQDGHGNDPRWGPPIAIPPAAPNEMGTHPSELSPLGDVSSQAPPAYDPTLLSEPPDTGQVFDLRTSGAPPGAADRHVGHGVVDSAVKQEIEKAVTQALSRKGIGGKVVVVGSNAELHGVAAGVVSINLGDWPSQWNLLPDDLKDRRAEAAAVRMSNALNDIVGKKRGGGTPVGPLLGKIAGALVVVALIAGVIWWLDRNSFFGDDGVTGGADPDTTAPVASGVSGAPAVDPGRAQRSCEAARSRLRSGASMGVDLDGWVVELWLARAGEGGKLATEPAIADLAANGATMVGTDFKAKSEATRDKTLAGDSVIIRLTEGFVPPFFESDGRNKLIDLAQTTATAVKAEYGALYGRCAHLPTRDIGSWYFGADRNKAAASLLYASGAGDFADPSAFDASRHGGDKVLSELLASVTKLPARDLDEALRLDGGRWVPVDESDKDGAIAINFAFGGPTRAAKVTRELSKKLGL